MILNNSLEHSEETTKIWREYNRQLTGSDYISRDVFKGIREHKPNHQTEILAVMYNHGRADGIERVLELVDLLFDGRTHITRDTITDLLEDDSILMEELTLEG